VDPRRSLNSAHWRQTFSTSGNRIVALQLIVMRTGLTRIPTDKLGVHYNEACRHYISYCYRARLPTGATNVCKHVERVKSDRLCGLVVRVPGYTTEMYCASCEVRTEFIYVM
jgi:hypothetical protein